jgi:hypothetical protein
MIELEFRNMLIFAEGGKPENPEKNPRGTPIQTLLVQADVQVNNLERYI